MNTKTSGTIKTNERKIKMKREYLEKLGLSKELIELIMTEHGKSINELKSRCESFDTLKTELETKNEKIDSLKSELEEHKKAFFDYRHKIICRLVEEAQPSSDIVKNALIDILEKTGDGDIHKKLQTLKNENPEAFVKSSSLPIFSVCEPINAAVKAYPFSRLR